MLDAAAGEPPQLGLARRRGGDEGGDGRGERFRAVVEHGGVGQPRDFAVGARVGKHGGRSAGQRLQHLRVERRRRIGMEEHDGAERAEQRLLRVLRPGRRLRVPAPPGGLAARLEGIRLADDANRHGRADPPLDGRLRGIDADAASSRVAAHDNADAGRGRRWLGFERAGLQAGMNVASRARRHAQTLLNAFRMEMAHRDEAVRLGDGAPKLREQDDGLRAIEHREVLQLGVQGAGNGRAQRAAQRRGESEEKGSGKQHHVRILLAAEPSAQLLHAREQGAVAPVEGVLEKLGEALAGAHHAAGGEAAQRRGVQHGPEPAGHPREKRRGDVIEVHAHGAAEQRDLVGGRRVART